MRITQNILIANFLRSLNSISARINRSEQQLASGKKYAKPSDGPVQISQIMGYQFSYDRTAQYMKNVDDGSSQVGYIDTVLQAVNDDVGRARDLAVDGANDNLNRNDRIAIGQEINLILQSTLSNGNTKFSDRYVFGGWKTRDLPFEAVVNPRTREIEDVIYRGNRGIIDRLVGDSDRLAVNVSGKELFMEQTYSRLGKTLPTTQPLGFQGVLTVNGLDFTITNDQTLKDIALMLNAQSAKSSVFATIKNSALFLESAKAVGEFVVFDDQNEQLLENLGIKLSGAFSTGTAAPVLPIIDSTPAILTGAGPVANLTYDGTNNVLNIFLGADANNGVSKAANIVITEGTYASVADLVTEIQTRVDAAFGAGKILVSDAGGGTLQIETVATGNAIDPGDLVIGGSYFGVPDTASDSTDLNLIAVVGNAPATPAPVAGTDGNDKLIIDLGPSASKNGLDVTPQTIDLRAGMITDADSLVEEIRYQIFQNNALRGAVEASLRNGRVHFETVKKGAEVLLSDFTISEGATNTMVSLGLSELPIEAKVTGAPLAFPFIVVAGFNDTLVFDLGPSVSADGTDLDPITITIDPGIYNNMNSIYNQLAAKIQGNMDLNGAIDITVVGPPGNEYLVISSKKSGSEVRGGDLNLTGNLAGTLGFIAGNAVAGGGTSDGQGIEIEPSNIFNTLINLRDDCYGGVGPKSVLINALNEDGDLLGLMEGDKITVSFDGNSYDFKVLAQDTLDNFVTNLQNLLGTRALVTLSGDNRISIQNLETSQILDFTVTAQSATGEQRTLFNQFFAEFPSSIPGLTSVNTNRMLDLSRYLRLGDEDLALADNDQQNILKNVATVGARANRLTTITNLFTSSQLNITGLKNSVEAANYAEVVTALSQQQLIFQSALGVGAKVLPPSLIDFLI